MRPVMTWALAVTLITASSIAVNSQTRRLAAVTVYEGARLIIGDASPLIENGAIVVQQGRIVAIGRKGELPVPADAGRLDLTGKTVMPAFVNIHAHLGWEVLSERGDIPAAPANFTPQNLLDHLQRQVF